MNQKKKVDRRVLRTRRMLKSALIELILEQGLDSISIRTLTDRADVGYATFYRHCKSKEELLMQIFLDLNAELLDHLQNRPTHYEEALALYEFVAEKRDVYLAACQLPRDHPAIEKAKSHMRELFVARTVNGVEVESPLEVYINHTMNSIWELIRWWIEEGVQHSPEEMATYQNELMVKLTEVPVFAADDEILPSS